MIAIFQHILSDKFVFGFGMKVRFMKRECRERANEYESLTKPVWALNFVNDVIYMLCLITFRFIRMAPLLLLFFCFGHPHCFIHGFCIRYSCFHTFLSLSLSHKCFFIWSFFILAIIFWLECWMPKRLRIIYVST